MKVRFFLKDETNLLQRMIHSLWAENHMLSRNEKLLHHMFYDNPLREGLCGPSNLSFAGLWDTDTIVGLFGIIPYKLNIAGTISKGIAAANWFVHPKYGGHGLKLLKPALSYNPDIILLLGTNNNATKLYQMMRWHVLDDVPRWVGIVNRKMLLESLQINSTNLNYWPEVKPVVSLDQHKLTSNLDKEKWDHYYWSSFAPRTVGFARDYDYLKWRYLDHPVFEYKFILSQDDKDNYNGLAIIRIEKILKEQYKIGRIVEFMALDKSSSISLANEIIASDPTILFWDFFSFSSLTTWGLENVGFRRIPKWMSNDPFIPSRFQPLDFNIVNIVSSMYISKNLMGKLNPMDDAQWYITKGDSDQDRPN